MCSKHQPQHSNGFDLQRLLLVTVVAILFGAVAPLNAQYYYFGRNKVHYENFDWRILQTEHFDIYFDADMLPMAETGARIAEEAFGVLKEDLQHTITYRIPLIFYNTHIHFQQTNITPGFIPEGVGGFFEFMKGRVVIPFLGSVGKFRHVIYHELTHVFMTSKLSRISKDRKWTDTYFPPLWFVEGIAEFYSTRPDAQAAMVMRDAVLNNYFTGIKNINAVYGSFIMYKFGQAFMEFVRERYGRWFVLRVLENIHLSEDFNEVISITLGKPVEQIDAEWLEHERKKYYPLVTTHSSNALAAKKVIDGGYNFDPNVLIDSLKRKYYIVYTANKDGYSSLFITEMDSTFTIELNTERVITAERGREHESVHLFEPSLTVSKEGIAAFVTRSGESDVIHLYDLLKKQEVSKLRFDGILSISDPSFSEKGDILFRGINGEASTDLYVWFREEQKLKRLTADNFNDASPVQGRTPTEVLFTSDRLGGEFSGVNNIFSIDTESGKISAVTAASTNFAWPKLIDGGRRLVAANDADGVYNLYEIDLNNGNFSDTAKPVSALYSGLETPYSYNDSTFFFTSIEKLTFDIYRFKPAKKPGLPDIISRTGTATFSEPYPALAKEAKKAVVEYQEEYTLDYAQSQISTDPVFGTRGGAVLSLSDMLGDDRYFMLLFNTAETQSDFLESFNIDISRLNTRNRTNFGYGVFNYRGRRYDLRESDEYYYEKSYGTYFFLQYPFSSFDRVETSISLANVNKDIIGFGNDQRSLLVSNSVAYVFDNSLWGPSGPLDGMRFRAQLGMTHDIRFGYENYYSLILDYRHYLRLLYTTSLAFRGSLYWNEGTTTRRYVAGGSWDLRGYPRFGLRGQKFWMTSVELRFPLIDRVALQLPFLGMSFSGIRGAFFFDAGSLWDKTYEETIGSVGLGFRFNLFNIIVFRYDIGKKIENNFSRFQDGLFYQFFFGWDF
ncbi:MAG: peptidase S9 [Chlorobiota bacterium]